MDELTELRRMRAAVPHPGADRLATGRQRLQAAIDEEETASQTALQRPLVMGEVMDDTVNSSRNPVRRRPLLSLAVAATAAVAVTATAVVADNVGDREGGSAGPATNHISAEKVLRRAADQARKAPEPAVPRDDQFIYTRSVTKETERKTHESKTYTDESWTSVDGSKHSWEVFLGEGNWTNPSDNQGRPPQYDWSELKKLPTDPVKLILELCTPIDPPLRPKSLKGVSKEEWKDLHSQLEGMVARAPVMPTELRAAAFDALAMVPGIKAKPFVTDAKGRSGIGIWSENALFEESKLVLDERSYKVLGTTGVRTPGKKHYDQFSYLDDYAIVDKLKQRP